MNFDIEKVKIFVTIPIEDVENVRNAVCKAGAGIIGNYSYCTSSSKSLGTFKPNNNANPYIGEKNKLEFVEEEKLEFVCDVNKVSYSVFLVNAGSGAFLRRGGARNCRARPEFPGDETRPTRAGRKHVALVYSAGCDIMS